MIFKKSERAAAWICKIADTLLCEIMEAYGGIHLRRQATQVPGRSLRSSVYTFTDHEHRIELSLSADAEMFARLSRNMLIGEPEQSDDIEECAQELFNVLCGRFLSELYRTTNMNMRFMPPKFFHEAVPLAVRQNAEYQQISYMSDRGESAIFAWNISPFHLAEIERNG